MKTSIFDATFTLPPMVEMTEVEKEMCTAATANWTVPRCGGPGDKSC